MKYFLLLLTIIFCFSCGNSNNATDDNTPQPKSNVEKSYSTTQALHVEAYCACMKGYSDYIKNKNSTHAEMIKTRMGREMNKAAQKCAQNYDKENPAIVQLGITLDMTDKKIYNSNFQKDFEKQCPEAAKLLLSLWGKVHPLNAFGK